MHVWCKLNRVAYKTVAALELVYTLGILTHSVCTELHWPLSTRESRRSLDARFV
jgi:hypothetical protein